MAEHKITVSDHALIRYLERRVGLDFTDYREEILTADLEIAALMCGDGRYPIGNGLVAIVRRNTVVTILGDLEDESE